MCKKTRPPCGHLPKSPPFRLTVHVGAGKTGTSSIQKTLLSNQSELNEQGIHYMGLMLEQAPLKKYLWQKQRGTEAFSELEGETRRQQALEVIRNSVKKFQDKGISHAIWSNESFLKRPNMVMDILRQLRSDGVDIVIIAYVRRHDAWMKSAYIQWGLKHKTYNGEIKSFNEWAERGKASFMPHLKSWISIFSKRVIVRNFDAADDAVVDFLNLVGFSPNGLLELQANQSPPTEELFLRALFNGQHVGSVLPWKFNNVFNSNSLHFDQSIDDWLVQMLPDQENLDRIRDDYADDRAELNKLLKASGQPLMQAAQLLREDQSLDVGKLLMALTQIIISQGIKINRMKRDISKIMKKDENHE